MHQPLESKKRKGRLKARKTDIVRDQVSMPPRGIEPDLAPVQAADLLQQVRPRSKETRS